MEIINNAITTLIKYCETQCFDCGVCELKDFCGKKISEWEKPENEIEIINNKIDRIIDFIKDIRG